MNRKSLYFFLAFIVILIFVFRSLIIGIATNLPDWYDYPLVVWIINSNVEKIISLDFVNIFNTNILYPNPNNLLLTETFITQSILALPSRAFTQNPILLFNIVFLLTYLLNYLASYLLWKQIFKKDWVAFVGGLLTVFSPFYHAEYSHFQMQSYWPALISLYFLFKTKLNNRNLLFSGIFVAVQFLASVYVSVFLIAAIFIYFLSNILTKGKIFEQFKKFMVIFIVFGILCAPVIISYINVQNAYRVQRDYGEFVYYSAHLSDYLFSGQISSIIHKMKLLQKWNSFNKHIAGEAALFPGFMLTVLLLMLIRINKVKNKILLSIDYSRNSLFFILLIIIGLLFSLGPRLNMNGHYAEIPLPYHFLVKYAPFVDVVRAPARWMILFYIGIIFFALKYLNKKIVKMYTIILVILIVLLEYLPVNIQTHAEKYIRPKDEILKEVCASDPKVVLELPVTHFDAGDSIVEGLNYITRTVLASTYHECNLVNGYTSYDLPSIAALKNSLYEASADGNTSKVVSLLKSSQAKVLVVNESVMKDEVKKDFLDIIKQLEEAKYLSAYKDGVYEIRIPGK